MSLREEMWKYEQITGESAEHIPIIKLGAFLDGYEMGIKALEQQPRPKGKWKYTEMGWFVVCNCSECGFQIDADEANNFCPYCGADMRGDKNEME